MKLSKQQEQYFKDKIENYKYVQKDRVSFYQGVYIALLVSIIILLVDFIPKGDYLIKLVLIFGLFLLAEFHYRRMLVQVQKPVFVGPNSIGTVERQHTVKDRSGKEWAIFSLSDFIYQGDNKDEKKKGR